MPSEKAAWEPPVLNCEAVDRAGQKVVPPVNWKPRTRMAGT